MRLTTPSGVTVVVSDEYGAQLKRAGYVEVTPVAVKKTEEPVEPKKSSVSRGSRKKK